MVWLLFLACSFSEVQVMSYQSCGVAGLVANRSS